MTVNWCFSFNFMLLFISDSKCVFEKMVLTMMKLKRYMLQLYFSICDSESTYVHVYVYMVLVYVHSPTRHI